MFGKLLSAIGIGSASVDTKLNTNAVQPGGMLSGVTHIKGGNSDQDLNPLYLHFVAKVKKTVETESGESYYYEQVSFSKVKISEGFALKSKEEKQIPFNIPVPNEIALTAYKGAPLKYKDGHPIGIKTALDIDSALDKSDYDPIHVEPNAAMNAFMQAMENMGFRIASAELETGRAVGSNLSFQQEIEFDARHTKYSSKISEVDVSFIGKQGGCDVKLEIEKKGFFGSSEKNLSFYLDYADYHKLDFEGWIDDVMRSI
ncbi:MAG: hypothetical protein EAZ57_03110 [Cytophagales bacterium]|nr:MAG: hypothetical protein EAZ67_03575 [Cytophagales bacterium]TAF61453.1 MAG: hypothetical protein EAZ57_03110 [Cytophagales bacterium]